MDDKLAFLDKIAYSIAAVFILRLVIPLDNVAASALVVIVLVAFQLKEKDKPKNAG